MRYFKALNGKNLDHKIDWGGKKAKQILNVDRKAAKFSHSGKFMTTIPFLCDGATWHLNGPIDNLKIC